MTGRAMRQEVARLFQDEDRFWIAAAFLVGALALLKGMRAPNQWAATQAQINYQFGFTKRGLFGEWIARPLHLWIYHRFAIFSGIALAVLVVLLCWFAHRTGITQRVSAIYLAVFASSYAVTYLGNLNGYLDILLAILATTVILARRPLVRYAVAFPVIVIALLIHESFLLILFPAMLVPFLLEAAAEPQPRRVSRLIVANNILILVAVGITLLIALHPSLTAQQVLLERAQIAGRADFPLRADFFDVFTRSTLDNIRIMIAYAHLQAWWIDVLSCTIAVAPMVALLLWVVRRLLQQDNPPGVARMYSTAVLASLSPLAMNLLGWDVGRWFALSELSTFLVFGAVCMHVRGPRIAVSPAMQRVAIVVIALNLVSGEALLDGLPIKAYPYLSQFRHPF